MTRMSTIRGRLRAMSLDGWLGVARIALGLVFLVRTTPLVNALPFPLARVRGPLYGWPEPGFVFAWAGFALPPSVRIVACIARTLAAMLFVAGVRPRISGIVAGALGLVAMSQDPFGFVFTLFVLFLGTMVLALRDAALVRVFVAAVYGWSALAKMHVEWLSGRTLHALAEDALLTPSSARLLLEHDALRVFAAWSIFLAELALGPLLLLSRTRRRALFAALALHAGFELGARPDVMGLVMASLLVAAALGDAPFNARGSRRSPRASPSP
jgi:hypothetical protein